MPKFGDGEFTVDADTAVISAHYSALTLHRECPQAWKYRYEDGLRRIETGPKPELQFGSWWSAIRATDSLIRGRNLESLQGRPDKMQPVDGWDRFDKATVTLEGPDGVWASLDRWWENQLRLGGEDLVAIWKERMEIEDLPSTMRHAYERWRARWSDQIAEEAPMAVELFWERVLPAQEPGAPAVRLYGFIDEVYKDLRRGIVTVRDQKTSKTLGPTSALDDMMDSQLMLYAWGAAPQVGSWDQGPIRMIQYDRMRSIQPKPPQLTLSGNLAVRGGEPSISGTDLKTYLEWAKGPDGRGVPWGDQGAYFASGPRKGQPKFGFYTAEDRVVEKLSTPAADSVWFQRKTVPLNVHVVRSHLRAAVDSAQDIRRTQIRVAATSEAQRNLSRNNCTWCDAVGLCRAQMMGGADGTYELADYGLVARDGRTQLRKVPN